MRQALIQGSAWVLLDGDPWEHWQRCTRRLRCGGGRGCAYISARPARTRYIGLAERNTRQAHAQQYGCHSYRNQAPPWLISSSAGSNVAAVVNCDILQLKGAHCDSVVEVMWASCVGLCSILCRWRVSVWSEDTGVLDLYRTGAQDRDKEAGRGVRVTYREHTVQGMLVTA